MLLPFRVDQLRSESNGSSQPQPPLPFSQSPDTSRSSSPAPSDLTRVHHHHHQGENNTNDSDDNNNSNSNSNSDAATLNGGGGPPIPQETLCVYIYPCAELPSVPYKLRFAIPPDEWDTRVQCIQKYVELAAKPIAETLWFSFFCIAIPVGVAYPLYMLILDLAELDAAANGETTSQGPTSGGDGGNASTGANTGGKQAPGGRLTREDKFYALLVPCIVSTLLFLLFLAPLLIRKYVLQRRVRKETVIWEEVDRKKLMAITTTTASTTGEEMKIRWRIRLPYLFSSACVIYIPIPPRTNEGTPEMMGLGLMQDRRLSRFMILGAGIGGDDDSVPHTRQNSWDTDVEANHPHHHGGGLGGSGLGVGGGGGGLLVRADSFGGQSRFEREERGVH
ncbi:hypothetical protein FRC19_005326 [Serendipita sp. 401]|nr:hypothetical protein FRC19_005326 [Serendipita sp. 401]